MMLQDIYPHKLNNQYDKAAQPSPCDFVLSYDGSKILAKVEGELMFPRVDMLKDSQISSLVYLFSVDDEKYFMLQKGAPDTLPINISGYDYLDLKELRELGAGPKYRIFATYTGKHLSDWYSSNVFCGKCGEHMEHSTIERALICPKCGFTTYPKIMPAVIVGVTNGDRILITKYKRGYNHSALIAGFTEIGETFEETVSREVMEEAGIKVKNIRYYKSQPWGIANDILAGFFCDVDGPDEIVMDENELKYAEWVKGPDIILQPDESSLTNEMMKLFKENGYDATI